jgi:hypothetical protein
MTTITAKDVINGTWVTKVKKGHKASVVSQKHVSVHPRDAQNYVAITEKLFGKGYELDYADDNSAVFLRGSNQVTVYVP